VKKSVAGTTPVVMSTILPRPPVFEVRRCLAPELGLVSRRNPFTPPPPPKKKRSQDLHSELKSGPREPTVTPKI
jgi:hypothetical protein